MCMTVQGASAVDHASDCLPSSASGPLPVVSVAFWRPGGQHTAKIEATFEIQLLLGELIIKVPPCIVCTASASILGLSRSSEEAANRTHVNSIPGLADRSNVPWSQYQQCSPDKSASWLQHLSEL